MRTAGAVAALLAGPAAVAICVLAVDRPAALFLHAAFAGHAGAFVALTHLVDPIPPLADAGLAGAGVAALLGWRPGRRGRALIACCLATLLAVALKDQLKFAFGRLWPETWVDGNPSLIRDGAFGFFPFHGGQGWASFPSGHTAVAAAPVAALWRRVPRGRGRVPGWRPLLAAPVALVAAGLLGADYHFVGDVVAGLCVGAACGAGADALVPEPRGMAPVAPP